MAFLKLRSERAYATGALRTPLSVREFAGKLKRLGHGARVDGNTLHISVRGDHWMFGDWQENGLERTGWLRFTCDGDISALSRVLAAAGVRHRFEWSRPFDLVTDDIRCITSYDYRWKDHTLGPGSMIASVDTYDEPVPDRATPVAAGQI
jgi:hypothetical protein